MNQSDAAVQVTANQKTTFCHRRRRHRHRRRLHVAHARCVATTAPHHAMTRASCLPVRHPPPARPRPSGLSGFREKGCAVDVDVNASTLAQWLVSAARRAPSLLARRRASLARAMLNSTTTRSEKIRLRDDDDLKIEPTTNCVRAGRQPAGKIQHQGQDIPGRLKLPACNSAR